MSKELQLAEDYYYGHKELNKDELLKLQDHFQRGLSQVTGQIEQIEVEEKFNQINYSPCKWTVEHQESGIISHCDHFEEALFLYKKYVVSGDNATLSIG